MGSGIDASLYRSIEKIGQIERINSTYKRTGVPMRHSRSFFLIFATVIYTGNMNKIVFWFRNARNVSLVQSFMPSVLAVFIAMQNDGFNILLAILAVLGVMLVHLAMNLADDYFDYRVNTSSSRKELNRHGIRARLVKYPYLTNGNADLKDLKSVIITLLCIAALLGGVIYFFRQDWRIILIALTALFFGIFYSAPPFKFSYRGLGELVIGIMFGPLLMTGIYIASCASMDNTIMAASLPVGLLVINIVFTHSYIDMKADEADNKMTFARLLKTNKANLTACYIFNFLPFVLIVAGVIAGYLHCLYLFTLLVLPRCVWLVWSLHKFASKKEIDLDKPAWYLGRMENWENIKKENVGWFMIRWYCARNIISAFCTIIIIINIILFLWL